MTDDLASVRGPDDPPDEADAYLDAELAASESALDDTFRSSLAQLLSAPEGLASRTAEGVNDALLNRSTLATAVDLVTVGWHTIRLLAGDPVDQRQDMH